MLKLVLCVITVHVDCSGLSTIVTKNAIISITCTVVFHQL